MSVYIKNMEMPKCCAECVALHDDGNSLTCLITHEPRGYIFPDTEERMSNCPLVPVPEHGSLIDKDALDIYRREEQAWHDYDQNLDNEYLEGLKDGLHEAAKQLSIAPTIIPADPADKEVEG